jgi:hypothetical protein
MNALFAFLAGLLAVAYVAALAVIFAAVVAVALDLLGVIDVVGFV